MGPYFNLQDGGIFAAAGGSKGLATSLTVALVRRQFPWLDDSRQVGVIAATVSLFAALLTTAPTRLVAGGCAC
jgi:hypothetical protein